MPDFWKWLVCLVRGHRDLCQADEYGAVYADGSLHELHHCGYCGRPVWIAKRMQPVRANSWKQLGI